MKGWLTIGRLAAAAGVPADTIRYYESVGLLPQPVRSEAGYRLYPRSEVRRLRLIARAKLLGLPLAEIKTLVDHTFTDSCAHLQEALLARIPVQLAELDRRIEELMALREELQRLQRHLSEIEPPADAVVAECAYCPVIDTTSSEEGSMPAHTVRL